MARKTGLMKQKGPVLTKRPAKLTLKKTQQRQSRQGNQGGSLVPGLVVAPPTRQRRAKVRINDNSAEFSGSVWLGNLTTPASSFNIGAVMFTQKLNPTMFPANCRLNKYGKMYDKVTWLDVEVEFTNSQASTFVGEIIGWFTFDANDASLTGNDAVQLAMEAGGVATDVKRPFRWRCDPKMLALQANKYVDPSNLTDRQAIAGLFRIAAAQNSMTTNTYLGSLKLHYRVKFTCPTEQLSSGSNFFSVTGSTSLTRALPFGTAPVWDKNGAMGNLMTYAAGVFTIPNLTTGCLWSFSSAVAVGSATDGDLYLLVPGTGWAQVADGNGSNMSGNTIVDSTTTCVQNAAMYSWNGANGASGTFTPAITSSTATVSTSFFSGVCLGGMTPNWGSQPTSSGFLALEQRLLRLESAMKTPQSNNNNNNTDNQGVVSRKRRGNSGRATPGFDDDQ